MVYLLRLRDNTCNYVRTLGERESSGCHGNPTTDAGHSYQCGRLLLAGRHGNEMVHFGKGIRVPAQFRALESRSRHTIEQHYGLPSYVAAVTLVTLGHYRSIP